MATQKTTSDQLRSVFKSILFILGIIFIIRTFLFSPYIVKGASMNPTLHNGERLVVNKLSYSIHDIVRGDIIIIQGDGQEKHYVKRVIGLPGEKIEMKNDELFIDNEKVAEPYLKRNRQAANYLEMELTGDFGPIQIPDDHLFVMGDNRLYSMDSRNGLGMIDIEDVIGKGEFVFYPVKNARKIN
ncbi:signal peptidase I [Priestia megaterium]|nr:signal peptidase I [Priestia megaterium]